MGELQANAFPADYAEADPLQSKLLVAHFNQFVLSTAAFLADFGARCKDKLQAQDVKIQRLRAAATLLEKKLESIPELRDFAQTAASSPSEEPTRSTGDVADVGLPEGEGHAHPGVPAPETAAVMTAPPPPPLPPPGTVSEPEEAANTAAAAAAANTTKAADHPRLVAFFKMLRVGVPTPAVKTKMAREGLDPDLLDDPDLQFPDALGAESELRKDED